MEFLSGIYPQAGNAESEKDAAPKASVLGARLDQLAAKKTKTAHAILRNQKEHAELEQKLQPQLQEYEAVRQELAEQMELETKAMHQATATAPPASTGPTESAGTFEIQPFGHFKLEPDQLRHLEAARRELAAARTEADEAQAKNATADRNVQAFVAQLLQLYTDLTQHIKRGPDPANEAGTGAAQGAAKGLKTEASAMEEEPLADTRAATQAEADNSDDAEQISQILRRNAEPIKATLAAAATPLPHG